MPPYATTAPAACRETITRLSGSAHSSISLSLTPRFSEVLVASQVLLSLSRVSLYLFKTLVHLLVPIAAATAGFAGTHPSDADKSSFNLFNPTPPEYMREMTVDGPGATDSPYTLDAGHFQLEMSIFHYANFQNTIDDVPYRLDFWAVAPFNLKIGLLNRLDLQVLIEPYDHVFEREDGIYRVTRQGFGDTTLRFKYNLWGNDSGHTALALLPSVRLPTGENDIGSDTVEGGLAVPFSADLPWDYFLGLETRFATAQDFFGGTRSHVEFANSALLAHKLFGEVEGYVEFFSNVSTESGVGWAGSFDTGIICWLTDDLQVNAGAAIGLTQWADDWSFFMGFAWRY